MYVHVCIIVFMYVNMCVCMYMCIFIYTVYVSSLFLLLIMYLLCMCMLHVYNKCMFLIFVLNVFFCQQVSSSDRDAEPFTTRTYSITSTSVSNIFFINPTTGEIFVSNSSEMGDLDYDSDPNSYSLIVEVSDGIQ